MAGTTTSGSDSRTYFKMDAAKRSNLQGALPWMLFWIHAISQLLMWVDEGYYDFRWMSDPWNWVIYGIYTSIISISAAGFFRLLFAKGRRHPFKTASAVALGFLATVLLLLALWMLR